MVNFLGQTQRLKHKSIPRRNSLDRCKQQNLRFIREKQNTKKKRFARKCQSVGSDVLTMFPKSNIGSVAAEQVYYLVLK